MDAYQNETKFCTLEHNLIELDGTCVCTQCGTVKDTIMFDNSCNYRRVLSTNSFITEVCHRLNIDLHTEMIANDIYSKAFSNYSSLRKNILLATAVYIATKKNTVPRTLKEINAVTGATERKIGEYERIICSKYHPINATHYINRFGAVWGLTYKEIKKIEEKIRISLSSTNIQNPVLLCATYLYKFMNHSNKCLIQIQEVTGIPVSTLKRAYKKEFKTC